MINDKLENLYLNINAYFDVKVVGDIQRFRDINAVQIFIRIAHTGKGNNSLSRITHACQKVSSNVTIVARVNRPDNCEKVDAKGLIYCILIPNELINKEEGKIVDELIVSLSSNLNVLEKQYRFLGLKWN